MQAVALKGEARFDAIVDLGVAGVYGIEAMYRSSRPVVRRVDRGTIEPEAKIRAVGKRKVVMAIPGGSYRGADTGMNYLPLSGWPWNRPAYGMSPAFVTRRADQQSVWMLESTFGREPYALVQISPDDTTVAMVADGSPSDLGTVENVRRVVNLSCEAVTVGTDGTVYVLHHESRAQSRRLVRLAPDGNVSAVSFPTVYGSRTVRSLAISPDGKRLAFGVRERPKNEPLPYKEPKIELLPVEQLVHVQKEAQEAAENWHEAQDAKLDKLWISVVDVSTWPSLPTPVSFDFPGELLSWSPDGYTLSALSTVSGTEHDKYDGQSLFVKIDME